ncbi:Naringenin 8-dimethylallyltransferase 1, chloroplastic [Dendrobium catenatum]|uniref:Naringenin 8-dimethylallyltransferase 1, chloroplastic n=1 Tax=Dendrobium catenatum TaxID=906689 RepID=A0A2I0X7G3_9ASPA|nr:Naringenin 8-dimethylallyltransferase 1, chloroplastic [Dendrobium catenatum]
MHTNPRTRPTLQRQPLARICARRITAMMSIIANLGIVLQISTFLHTQDVPDIEGDKKFGIRSLAASLGPKKISSHSALGLILWKQSGSIDLKDKFSLQSFYMLIWKESWGTLHEIHQLPAVIQPLGLMAVRPPVITASPTGRYAKFMPPELAAVTKPPVKPPALKITGALPAAKTAGVK